MCPTLAGGFFTSKLPGEAPILVIFFFFFALDGIAYVKLELHLFCPLSFKETSSFSKRPRTNSGKRLRVWYKTQVPDCDRDLCLTNQTGKPSHYPPEVLLSVEKGPLWSFHPMPLFSK